MKLQDVMEGSAPSTIRYCLAGCVITILVVIAAWDLFVNATGREQDSVSYAFADWASKYPIFAFGLGVLVGHIFWPQGPWR